MNLTEDEYRDGIFAILGDPEGNHPTIYNSAVDVALTRGWVQVGEYRYKGMSAAALPDQVSYQEWLVRQFREWAKIDAHEEGDGLVDDRVRGGVDPVGAADDDGASVPDRVVGAGPAVRGDGESVAGGADGA